MKLALLAAAAAAAAANRTPESVAAFAIRTALPANASHPSDKEYVAVGAVDQSSLPAGTTFLRLVIVDGGCGNAIPMPMEWAPMPSTQEMMFSPVRPSWDAPTQATHFPRHTHASPPSAKSLNASRWPPLSGELLQLLERKLYQATHRRHL